MTVDWSVFTPGAALAGGLGIGAAAALLLLLGGRVAGVSGILGGLLRRQVPGERAWRIAFLGGLVLSPWLYGAVRQPLQLQLDTHWGMLVVAGLLVGLGTRYGAGCTSGHGVCGLSRLSLRSAAATAVFMAAGFMTVFVARHLLGGGQ